jgi:hypothetical protein
MGNVGEEWEELMEAIEGVMERGGECKGRAYA